MGFLIRICSLQGQNWDKPQETLHSCFFLTGWVVGYSPWQVNWSKCVKSVGCLFNRKYVLNLCPLRLLLVKKLVILCLLHSGVLLLCLVQKEAMFGLKLKSVTESCHTLSPSPGVRGLWEVVREPDLKNISAREVWTYWASARFSMRETINVVQNVSLPVRWLSFKWSLFGVISQEIVIVTHRLHGLHPWLMCWHVSYTPP